jgi:DNA-binding YbaB/EbfC family protein
VQPNMKMIQQMQQRLVKAQEELGSATVEGSAGGGAVTVTMTGHMQAQVVKIDPAAVDPEDVETLEDLVVAALLDAAQAAQDLAAEKMGPLTGGMGGLGLPGF